MDRTGAVRHFFFGTNLKMNQTASDTVAFLDGLLDRAGLDDTATRYFVIPPFTSIPAATRHPAHRSLWIGAQNMHWAADGAFTGEISASMLHEFGVDMVLIGHAERRQHFGETDEIVCRKTRTALTSGFRTLLCIGETAAERNAGIGIERVREQLRVAVQGISSADARRLLIAYEPVWAIGEGGAPADPVEVGVVMVAIRSTLEECFSPSVRPPLLYGGSVDLENCGAFAEIPAIDGLFVGRSAWTVDGFIKTAARSRSARFGIHE